MDKNKLIGARFLDGLGSPVWILEHHTGDSYLCYYPSQSPNSPIFTYTELFSLFTFDAYESGAQRGKIHFPVTSTSNATPVTLGSIEVAEGQQVSVEVDIQVTKTDFSNYGGQKLIASFARAVSGNVTRTSASDLAAVDTLSEHNFASPVAVALVANPSTQKIDIVATPLAATNLKFGVTGLVKYGTF